MGKPISIDMMWVSPVLDRERKSRKHGTVLFLLPDKSGDGRLAAELRNMKTWPLMIVRSGAESHSQIIVQGGDPISVGYFQHLSIPADFNIHFSDPAGNRRIFFDAIDLSKSICHLFSFVSRGVDYYPKPKGVWREGAAVIIFRAGYYANLSLVLDFYVHASSVPPSNITVQGQTVNNASYKGILGPFGIPVSDKNRLSNIFCTVRYGSCYNAYPNAETFLIPRAIRTSAWDQV